MSRSAFAATAAAVLLIVAAPSVRAAEGDDAAVAPAAVTAAEPATAPAAIDAADFDLARYRGRVVYLDFWASWCAPCVRSFPWLAKLHAERADDGFVVVAVNLDRERAAADRFLQKHPVPFPIVYDPEGKLAKAWDIDVMPSSFLVDRDGRTRHDHAGFRDADAARIEAEIDALLKEAPSAEGTR